MATVTVITHHCVRCGAEFTRKPTRGTVPKWCSAECRNLGPTSRQRTNRCRRCGQPARPDARYCSLSCASYRKAARLRQHIAATGSRSHRILIHGPCVTCGTPFTRIHPRDLTCSPACSKTRRHKAKPPRSARNRKRRQVIFERDNWICWLCNTPTNKTAPVPNRDAPTIDHVIPRSLGGSDDPTNLRCAHFLCNSKRGNAPQAGTP